MATTLTQTQIDALRTTLVARWNAGLAKPADDWKKIAKVIQSSGKSNTYAWLTQFPSFIQWTGARTHKAVADRAYMVPNRRFETTVDVLVDDIDDDNLGQYGTLAESAGQSALDLMNDLVFQALAAGTAATCYDGQFFFDTDHPVYPNEDGTGVAATVSNLLTPANNPVALWVLACTKRAPSPIYLQERMKPRFDMLTNVQSDQVFNYDKISFGGKWRGEAAYGFWQCAVGSTNPLTSASLADAINAMMAFKGDGNRKLGLIPDTLIVGPSNRVAAETLINASTAANGAANIDYKRVDLVVTPWMT